MSSSHVYIRLGLRTSVAKTLSLTTNESANNRERKTSKTKTKKKRNKQKAALHDVPQSMLTIPGPVIRVQLTTVVQFCSHI